MSKNDTSSMQLFEYEGASVRTVMINGEPWLVAKDVCDILGIANARDAVSELDEDENNTVAITDGNRGNPNMNVINEPGLYKLTFKSRKPAAKKFTRWVTHEVLPALRKTGSYHTKSRFSPTKSFKDAESLIDKAFHCSTEADCQQVRSLDRVFHELYGYSVLEVGEIQLEVNQEAQHRTREEELWEHIVSRFAVNEYFSTSTLQQTLEDKIWSKRQLQRYLSTFIKKQMLNRHGYSKETKYIRRH